MIKLLLYRSVRTEEMAYVVDDIFEKYGNKVELSILTRPEQKITMELISSVKKVYTYSNHIFQYSDKYIDEINILRNCNYDLVIIPTTGNIESYQNILKFNKFIFGKVETKFYKYPKTFIGTEKTLLRLIYSNFLKFISVVLTIPLLIIFYIYTIVSNLFN